MVEERLEGPPNPSILAALEALQRVEKGSPTDDAVLLAHLRHQLDLLLAGCAREIAEKGLYESYTSPVQWLRNEARLATGVAVAMLAVGCAREQLELSQSALAAGEIGFGHLGLMAEAESRLGESFEEARLLKKARAQTVTEFRKTVEHAFHAAFPERFAAAEAEAREHRFLKLSPAEDGSAFLKGWLDAEGASLVRSALEPLARPGGGQDQRRREQRLGDALVELASQGVRTELIVSVPLETLLQARQAPAAETEWGGLLSSEVVRRLLCDADVRRLVPDGEGAVVDFGRRRRLFSPAQRKAMAGRDGRCIFPGCDRPPGWCQGHHKQAFKDGGGTDLANGGLLCGRHHYLCHEGGWKLVRDGPRIRAIPPARAA